MIYGVTRRIELSAFVFVSPSLISDAVLGHAKWPDQLPDTTWEHGADIGTMRKLADYWEKKYDWRAQEAGINRFDQCDTGGA